MPFHGDVIHTFEHDGAYWVAMRRIVENLGMDWKSQSVKLREQQGKFNCGDIATVADDGKMRAMLAMPTTKLALWLASINPNKVAESVRPKLERYQAKSAIALHDYWTKGVVVNARDEMLSLTDMWKAAKGDDARRPNDWLASAEAKRFIDVLAEVTDAGNSGIALVGTKKGGKDQGTWAHWQIGLAYAKYLSPAFHMWCNTVVRERMEGRSVTAVVQDGALMPCRDRRPWPKVQRADGFDPKSTKRPTVEVTEGVFRSGPRGSGQPGPNRYPRSYPDKFVYRASGKKFLLNH